MVPTGAIFFKEAVSLRHAAGAMPDHGWRHLWGNRTMKLFAHTEMGYCTRLAAVAHLLFNVYLIVVSRAGRAVAVRGAGMPLRGVHIWNINSISHNFIHTPTSRSGGSIAPSACLRSITIGFSQTYYHWVHMRHHSRNSDKPDER
jgi:hypothetical protein